MRTHRLAILATFIFCIVASAARAASTEWKPYPFGAPGDYPPVVDACEAGSYIVGFRIRSGAWFDKIGPICGALNSAGTSWSHPTVSVMRGGDGGGGPIDFTCMTNELIGSIEVEANDELKVNRLRVHCHDLTNPNEKTTIIAPPGAFVMYHHQDQTCNPGDRAIAIKVHYGKYVNAIGLSCGPVKPAALLVECAAYGLRMSTMVTDAVERTCAFINGGGGWNNPRDYWQRQCEHDPGLARVNESALKRQLDECTTAPASMKVKVLALNTVYKQPSGEDTPQNTVCAVRPGDTADLIAKGPEHWFNLGNISGDCRGQAGWIWDSGGELQLP